MHLPHITAQQVQADLSKHGVSYGLMRPSDYHATKELFDIHVSKTTLHRFMQCPYKAKNKPFKPTKSTEFGNLVDCMLLTPDLFEEEYLRVEKKLDGRTAEAKALKAQAEEAGKKLFFADDNAEALSAVINAKKALTQTLGADGYLTQVAIFVRLEVGEKKTPIILSGLLDILPTDFVNFGIWDLKTTSAPVEDEKKLFADMHKYGYPIQAAIYLDLLSAVFKDVPDTFTFLFVESTLPSCARLVTMTAADIVSARAQYQAALEAYAIAAKTKDWGSPILPPTTYAEPTWVAYQHDEDEL